MKSIKSKKLKKVEKFNKGLLTTLEAASSKLKKSKKMCISALRLRMNKNIILLKVSDTNEIVELINTEVLSKKISEEKENNLTISITYQNKEGKKESAILTAEDAINFYKEYCFIHNK